MQHPDALVAILIFAFIGLIIFSLWWARQGKTIFVRRIPGISAIEEAVGRATETGGPVVFALGLSDIKNVVTHVSLAVLSHVARLAARLRTPIITAVPVPDVYPFAEETVREAFKAEGALDQFDSDKHVIYTSPNSIVSAMTVARMIEEQHAGCAMFVGGFDFASLLMAEPGAQAGVIQIAADPSLGQIPFFVCTCDYTIIGEEYFAGGAYISPDPSTRGTLLAQDIVKAIFVAMILLGLICYHLDLPFAQRIVEHFTQYR